MNYSPSDNDRSVFATRIDHARVQGNQALRASGAQPDLILYDLLSGKADDQRYGINLVMRPPANVLQQIRAIQQHLRIAEPRQYYYPDTDLHLTLLEVLAARPLQPLASVVTLVREHVDEIFTDLPTPQLDTPLFVFDQHACALNFLPTDGRLQLLRSLLDERLKNLGIPVTSRYPPQSAHFTIMRYIRPLQTNIETWLERLLSVPLQSHLSWTLDSVTLTWGSNWYSMHQRIEEDGPHRLGQKRKMQ